MMRAFRYEKINERKEREKRRRRKEKKEVDWKKDRNDKVAWRYCRLGRKG
jgi:hypothetical protein